MDKSVEITEEFVIPFVEDVYEKRIGSADDAVAFSASMMRVSVLILCKSLGTDLPFAESLIDKIQTVIREVDWDDVAPQALGDRDED